MDFSEFFHDEKTVFAVIRALEEAGAPSTTVWLVDWQNPERNHFAFSEEVTIEGRHIKRPDIVIYLNGIAIGVLELKRSTVSVSAGIRQNLDNQRREFIRPFFTTIQLIMAGNDTEGLRYGTIDTLKILSGVEGGKPGL